MNDTHLNPPDYDMKRFEAFIEDETRELMQEKFAPFSLSNIGEGFDHWIGTEYETIISYIEHREFEKLGRNFWATIHSYFERQAEEFAASQYNERIGGGQ